MKNNISIVKKQCVGCTACGQACLKNAIEFEYNDEGFLYPVVISDKCVQCGICLEVCPALKSNVFGHGFSKKFYGFSGKNDYKIHSASGGFATFLSERIIDEGGVVCGCALIGKEAKHIIVKNKEDLRALQSSKYVQSSTLGVFKNLKKILDDGRIVLFIGTPCQVQGLKLFLKKDYYNLILIDLICHGVPSPKLFLNYLNYLEEKEKSRIQDYNFRYKLKRGWGTYFYYYCIDTRKKRTGPLELDKYGNDFIKAFNYRESCYLCNFANLEARPGDFTIGDFWGILKVNPAKFDKYGVSSVIVNTPKGSGLINKYMNNSLFCVKKEDVLLKQGNLIHPTPRPQIRDEYYSEMRDPGFFVAKKEPRSIKAWIKSLLPVWITNLLKRC